MGNVTLSPGQIAQYALGAGFRGMSLVTAVAIAMAESGGNTWAINNNTDGSQDQGVWQINTVHAASYPGMVFDPGAGHVAAIGASIMFNPVENAGAAYDLSSGGASFRAWSTYNNGAYTKFLDTATTASVNPVAGPDLGPAGTSIGGVFTGGPASNPGMGQYLVDDHDTPVLSTTNGADLIKAVAPSNRITGLVIAGISDDIGPYCDDTGKVELDADQVGQITFTVYDQEGKFGKVLCGFDRNSPVNVAYQGMKFQISHIETGSSVYPFPVYQVTASVAVAHQMQCLINPPTMPHGVAPSSGMDTLGDTASGNSTTVTETNGSSAAIVEGSTLAGTLPGAAVPANPDGGLTGVTGTTITPTDYINFWVNKFKGVLVFGQQTYTQSVISPMPITQGMPAEIYGESLYDLVSRLASNYGYWFFDADGINCYFGAPSSAIFTVDQNGGLIQRGTPFYVSWGAAWFGNPVYDAIEYPDCSKTTQDIFTPATVVVKLPRDRGMAIRPGMAMWLRGVTGFDGNGDGQSYLVTKVTWALDSGQTPVTVTAVTPIDPIPLDLALLPAPSLTGSGMAGVNPNSVTGKGSTADLSADPTKTHNVQDFLTFAKLQIGTPYVWGGHNPGGFDCSGLVEWAAAQVGVAFPAAGYSGPLSQQQYQQCVDAGTTLPVSVAATIPGALLFKGPNGNDHVAISMGDGKTVLQAPHTGALVSFDNFGSTAALEAYFNLAAKIPGVDYHTQVVPIGGTGVPLLTPQQTHELNPG